MNEIKVYTYGIKGGLNHEELTEALAYNICIYHTKKYTFLVGTDYEVKNYIIEVLKDKVTFIEHRLQYFGGIIYN